MKKLIALLLACMMITTVFASCGEKDSEKDNEKSSKSSHMSDKDKDDDDDDEEEDDDDDEKDDKSDKSSDDKEDDKSSKDNKDDKEDDESLNKENKKDDADPDKKDTDNSSKKDKTTNVSDEVYIDVLRNFCNAVDKGEKEELMLLLFPEDIFNAFKKTGALDAMTEQFELDDMDMEDVKENLDKITVSNVEDCDEDEILKLEKIYSIFNNLFVVMADNDITYDDMESGNIDESTLMLLLEPAMAMSNINDIENADVDLTIVFDDAKHVTYSFTDENGDSEEQEFILYKSAGEDWKLDVIGLALSLQ